MKRPNIVQVNEEDSQCIECNFVADTVYVTAKSDEDGYLFAKQNGGMCAECFLAKIFEGE